MDLLIVETFQNDDNLFQECSFWRTERTVAMSEADVCFDNLIVETGAGVAARRTGIQPGPAAGGSARAKMARLHL